MSGNPIQHGWAAALLAPGMLAPVDVHGADEADAARRFSVHRNTFVVSLVDALAESFPVTQALVGPAFFRAMARERVLADPPRSPVLTDFALGFADFIECFPPAAGVAYLADVARVEALRIETYHAADAEPLMATCFHPLLADPRRLAGTRLHLHPACRWLRSRHAAYSIWNAHQGLDDIAEAALERVDVERAEDVLVTRPQWAVATTLLPTGAVEWLDALRAGLTLGEAGQQAATVPGTNLAALFELLVKRGLATAITTSPGECS